MKSHGENMGTFLNNMRTAEHKLSIWKQIMYTAGILSLGIILGTASKYLDCTPSNELPYWIEKLDFRNFFGRFAIWIFLAVCISIYSKTSVRASINVFVFFVGMVGSYYLYSKYVAGFFPYSYALIWIGFTIISPLLAFICWYAKGSGKVPLIISAGIIAVLFNTTFAYGFVYFDVKSPLELAVFALAIIILRRTVKETIIMVSIGAVIAFALNSIVPF